MPFLKPTSIAVIGASQTAGKVGHAILENLLTQGFKGEVYPVNPKHTEILGKKAYASIDDIPEVPELAVIVTPAPTVPSLTKGCVEKGVQTLVIISAGFSETGTAEGRSLEEEIQEVARQGKVELIGTNCLGVLRPSISLNASFAKSLPPAGNIALISQSGALAVALIDAAKKEHLGYSLVLSVGNKTLLDECDYLEHIAEDTETKVIALYLEGVRSGERFRRIAERVAPKKPIILLKSGISSHGSQAVSSHTGALAGSDAAIDAVCAGTGIHRAHTFEEFVDLLEAFSKQPRLLSPRIAIITNAGGPGILATDAAENTGFLLPPLERSIDALRKALPEAASVANPIDVLGDAGEERFAAALEAVGEDPGIDGVCLLVTPQVMTPCQAIAERVATWNMRYPLMATVTSFMGGESVDGVRTFLRRSGIPSFETPERAINALRALLAGAKKVKQKKPKLDHTRIAAAQKILQSFPPSKTAGNLLSEERARDLLTLYEVPCPKQALARSASEAGELAKQVGFPVVLKVSSPTILHKVDVGGVRLNIETREEAETAFTEIMEKVKTKAPRAEIRGVLVQQFLPVGDEFIIGGIRDPSFGPLIMVGLGGIYTELFRDTSFRMAPIEEEEGYHMLQELRAWKMLLGIRGKEQADIVSLAQLLERTSLLLAECEAIKELDFNPVLVSKEGVLIADAKVIIGQ